MAQQPQAAPKAQPMTVTPEQIQAAATIGMSVMQDPTTKVPMSAVTSGDATVLLGLLTVLANGQCVVVPSTPPEPTAAEKKAAKKAEKAAAKEEAKEKITKPTAVK